MRTTIASFSLALFFIGGTMGQECSKFYLLKEGASFQYTNYNKKGKTVGLADYKVSDVSTNGAITEASMSVVLSNEQGKQIQSSSYSISCSDDKVTIDYHSLLPDNMMQQMGEMEMEFTGTDLELPNDLNIGESLPDANMVMTMNMGGMKMKTVVNILNRTVEKKETVTTAAGTFDCYVISSDNQTIAMGINKTYPSRLWLAEGTGMIKHESYQKNGELIGRTELTAFSH